ncbi:MAG: hypothetical protein WAT39_15105, partial [Planctomycetota bacterium]
AASLLEHALGPRRLRTFHHRLLITRPLHADSEGEVDTGCLGAGLAGSIGVWTLLVRTNGDLIAGGWFNMTTGPGNSARWDGTAWTPFATGSINNVATLTEMPNGDLIAGGDSLSQSGGLARWDGTTWSALPGVGGLTASVRALAVSNEGNLIAGGGFTIAGGQVSASIARLATTCPALVAAYGAGCASSAGPMTLSATSLPWIGGTFRAIAGGMPVSSLALAVRGLASTSVGLPSILPQGVAGCSLLATADLIDLVVPTAGSAQVQFAVPAALALVGQSLFQQVVAVELGPTGAIVAATSTNGLALTFGSW